MRSNVLSLGVLALAAAAVPLACSAASSDETETSVAAATDDELALAALTILGAKVDGAEQQCQRCHDINTATLKRWADDYGKTMAVLKDESRSADERVAYMRRDPTDPTSTFAPAKIGFLAAGAHLGTSPSVSPERHPLAYAEGKLLSALFTDKGDDYARFRSSVLMPIEPEYDRLTARDYETIATWVGKGMPKLTDYLREEPRPTSCTDSFAELAAHARTMKTKGWTAVNRDAKVPMLGCDPGAPALSCFQQKAGAGDVFPDAQTTEYGKGWASEGTSVRVLRALEYRTFFWMRPSSDGRFVANGVSSGGEDGAVIADLQAALDPAGPKVRDIWAGARYDPDFWPDNQGFMFQGTPNGATFCAQSLLTRPETTRISFREPECSKLNSVGLYQTIGQRLGDNAIADHFVVNSKFASDNGGHSASDHDQPATFGPDAKVIIRSMMAKGNDATEGYEVVQSVELPTPFEGDTMMSRSATLVASRVAGQSGPLGYAVRRLSATMGDTGYKFAMKEVGKICMAGGKANFSFDERFLTTHHYLTREDFPSDEAYAAHAEKGGADVWIADFVTGQKVRVTRMGPGQFALFPHFRSDGWLYFLVRDAVTHKEYLVASDAALRMIEASP